MIKINRKLFILSLAAAMISTHSVYGAAYWLPEYPDKGFNGYSEDGNGGFIYSAAQECRDNGYTIKSCPAGSHPVHKCPTGLDSSLYKECFSNAAACTGEGYVLSCPAGQEPDLTKYCNHDNLYIKCKCSLCLGYDYSEAEANSLGYIADGQPCNSCGTLKYKRKAAPCDGYNYDSSNCGVNECQTLEGATCQSGNILKYKECKACPPPVPTCDYPKVKIDTYWCNGALRCWLPAEIDNI